MNCTLVVTLVAAAVLADAGAWRNKPLAQWNDTDAKEFLTDSPWVGIVDIQPIPPRSPGARRESGDWQSGVGRGVGIAGTGILGKTRERLALEKAHQLPDPGKVTVLWASAEPVRTAARILKAEPTPDWSRDFYEIAVVDFPVPKDLDKKHLKDAAYLRRSGKKDLRPTRVETVHLAGDDVTLVYLFPRHEEITMRDGVVLFGAQVGQAVVSHWFHVDQMVMNGAPEL